MVASVSIIEPQPLKNTDTDLFLWYDIFRSDDSHIIILAPDYPESLTILRDYHNHLFLDGCEIRFVSSSYDKYERWIYVAEIIPNNITQLDVYFFSSGSSDQKTFYISPNPIKAVASEYGIQTIFKNDADFLPLWIAYHYNNMKFGTFLLYNNNPKNSTGLTGNELTKLCTRHGFLQIIIINWPFPYRDYRGGITGQISAQNHGIYLSRPHVKYLMLNDLDEYLVPRSLEPKIQDVVDLIQMIPLENCAASIETVWFGCNPSFQPVYTPYNFTSAILWRNSVSCGPTERPKCIVKTNEIIVFTVHIVFESPKRTFFVPPDTVWFHHYSSVSHPQNMCIGPAVYDDFFGKK